jgi:sortase A
LQLTRPLTKRRVRKKKSAGQDANLWVEDMILRVKTTASRGWLGITGRFTTALGMALVAIYAGAAIHRALSSSRALREFDQTHFVVSPESQKAPTPLSANQEIDFSLWSKGRVVAYRGDPGTKKGSPLAVLRLEKFNVRVPVFAGTDDWTLNRGAGWILGTTRPGEAGNIGIAGHRDSFFRVLKDVHNGDAIELTSATGTATYTVSKVEIVDPDDVSVLQPREAPSLTLVTCYPFYFVGPAPRRFIVHAALRKQSAIRESAN